MENGGLVEQDASAVDGTRKGHLVRMKIVEGRLPPDFVGLVPQDVVERVGGEEDVGFRGEVWRTLESARGRELGLVRSTYCV